MANGADSTCERRCHDRRVHRTHQLLCGQSRLIQGLLDTSVALGACRGSVDLGAVHKVDPEQMQASEAGQLISMEASETGASLARDSCESLRTVVSFSSPSFMAPLKHPALYGLSSEAVPPGLAPPAAAAKASKGSRHVWQSCEGSASSLSSLCVPYSQAVRMPFNTTMHPRTQQTYLQPDHPRAYSASHALGRQARPAQTGCLPRMASIEAVRLSSNAVPQQEPSLSPDVSKISFRILTSGSKWAGQRGPYSPLTPIPDSPNTPLHWCRCSVHRTKHGGYKDGRFEMQDSSNGVTLVAQRTTRSRSYDIFMYSRIADVKYLGSLQANSRQTRFLLVGAMGVSHPSGLNHNVDPVHMAISYGKPLEGCKHALVIIPGNPGGDVKQEPSTPA
ncbi:hypothetical protein WJX79_003416 [Trebouxia sp. C0005]